MIDKVKVLGQVYTSSDIVCKMLDLINYQESNNDILYKHIIEPSCGDGSFLIEIVKRYVKCSLNNKISNDKIISNLEKYIVAIEIDNIELSKAIINVNNVVKTLLNEDKVNWNFTNGNTLYNYNNFENKFDYVVGNPPYVKIHNINKEDKEFIKNNLIFSKGSFDLYMSFYEIGLKLLNEDGKLCYISPNSWLKNNSYKKFRGYLNENKLISYLKDYGSENMFKNVSTYNSIVVLNKKPVKNCIYIEITSEGKPNNNKKTIGDYFDVQYALCTLYDKAYIVDEKFSTVDLFKPVLKASRPTEFDLYILFPYKRNSINNKWELIEEEEFQEYYPTAYNHINQYRDILLNRNLTPNTKWYEYGRSQAIQKSHKEKYAVSNIFKDKIIFQNVGYDYLVYSGIIITKKNDNVNLDILNDILSSKEFYNYCFTKSKDMKGGYKTLTSKIIKNYIIEDFFTK
ncbi:MAG: Eco57I restriction-modification methylase domain-containing protein [Novosphingobium sp.]|nr:Eco57I restriction-modification methylase domain-containing protein [Novosphingobium sp.]